MLQPLGYRTGQFGKNHFERPRTSICRRLPRASMKILRQPVSPQCRGGTGGAGYPPEGPIIRTLKRISVHRGVLHCWANGTTAPSASKIPARHQEANWRRRRRGVHEGRPSASSRRRLASAANRSSCGSHTHHCTSATMPVPRTLARSGRWPIGIPRRGLSSRSTASVRCWIWWMSLGHHRQHDRDCYSTTTAAQWNKLARWPALTPFRNEKKLQWEGAYRVLPADGALARGHRARQPASPASFSHLRLGGPHAVAAAGEPRHSKQKCLEGHTVGSKTFKVHLVATTCLDYWTGKTDHQPRVDYSTSLMMAISPPCVY